MTSTSKSTKSMATKKYFTENGILALPTDSIPHSKFLSLFLECLLGPRSPDIIMVPTTKPIAKPACISIGSKSNCVDCITLDFNSKLIDGKVNDRKIILSEYNVHSFPTSILIDKSGIIIGRYDTSNKDELEKKLKTIFKE